MPGPRANVEVTTAGPAADRSLWLMPVVLGVACLVYLPALPAPFIFDDLSAIPANPHLRHLSPLSEALSAPEQTPLAGRPVVSLSLAINYALGELDVRGYRAVNLIIHLLNAVLLFAIARRTLGSAAFGRGSERTAGWIALAITALWALHPLCTESVIYVIQRTELLMALFLLCTLYCTIRASASNRPQPWQVAAVAACAMGMACKEVMVAAPLVVLLHDRAFLAGTFRAALGRRRFLYTGLAATWGILAALLATGPRSASIGFHHGIGPLDYLGTQAGVLLRYLLLCIYPHPLVISYDDWPIATSFGDALLPGLVIAALLAGTGWALFRRPVSGFVGAWFFLILAPTSSFVPIVTEVAAERRMYLPLLAPIAILVVAGYALLKSGCRRLSCRPSREVWLAAAAAATVAGSAAVLTRQRALDYRTAVAIWQDTVDKRPRNALAHVNLGNALFATGDQDAAIGHYETALESKPADAKAHYNLANALAAQNRTPDALPHYAEAIKADPDYADAHYNLGIALTRLGRADAAAEHLRQAVRINPAHVGAYNNLGLVLARQGKSEEAIQSFRHALRVDPDSLVTRRNLGDALLDLGEFDLAAAEYRAVLARDPDRVDARCNLGITLAMQNKRAEAIHQLREALRRQPNHPGARRVLNDLVAGESGAGPN